MHWLVSSSCEHFPQHLNNPAHFYFSLSMFTLLSRGQLRLKENYFFGSLPTKVCEIRVNTRMSLYIIICCPLTPHRSHSHYIFRVIFVYMWYECTEMKLLFVALINFYSFLYNSWFNIFQYIYIEKFNQYWKCGDIRVYYMQVLPSGQSIIRLQICKHVSTNGLSKIFAFSLDLLVKANEKIGCIYYPKLSVFI